MPALGSFCEDSRRQGPGAEYFLSAPRTVGQSDAQRKGVKGTWSSSGTVGGRGAPLPGRGGPSGAHPVNREGVGAFTWKRRVPRAWKPFALMSAFSGSFIWATVLSAPPCWALGEAGFCPPAPREAGLPRARSCRKVRAPGPGVLGPWNQPGPACWPLSR